MALVTVVVAAAFLAAPAVAQEADLRSMLEDIKRLRADLADVQRFVYRGELPPPSTVPPATSLDDAAARQRSAQLEVRLGELEDQMRQLTGRVEEVAHGIDLVGRRLEKLVADVDFRLTEIEAAQVAARSEAGPQPGEPEPEALEGGGTDAEAEADPAPGTLGTISEAPEDVLPDGTPDEQYNHAYNLLRQLEYAKAEHAFRAFIAAYPEHGLTGNAYYWLAETFYVRGDYERAAQNFARGYRDFTSGTKASDNLLKLGMSLARLERKEDACLTFAELAERFPDASSTIRSRARDERAKADCK